MVNNRAIALYLNKINSTCDPAQCPTLNSGRSLPRSGTCPFSLLVCENK
ncbi:MAG: hypothetical protein F6K09_17670 [Merismopedia sp. SIO2A8]|nr:hypothetical protein [Merismopedia sp. SIO2A8]